LPSGVQKKPAGQLVGALGDGSQAMLHAAGGGSSEHRLPNVLEPPQAASVLLSVPINAPVDALNALILPSPKLPISTALLNVPKSAGASATPQGAFSVPPVAIRRMNLPSVWNRLTTPSPTPTSGSCFAPSCIA